MSPSSNNEKNPKYASPEYAFGTVPSFTTNRPFWKYSIVVLVDTIVNTSV